MLSFRAKSRMEPLGSRGMDGKGRRLSEGEVSESNPVAKPRVSPRGPSTSLCFAQDDGRLR